VRQWPRVAAGSVIPFTKCRFQVNYSPSNGLAAYFRGRWRPMPRCAFPVPQADRWPLRPEPDRFWFCEFGNGAGDRSGRPRDYGPNGFNIVTKAPSDDPGEFPSEWASSVPGTCSSPSNASGRDSSPNSAG
jgi:hypothetical protein